MNGCGLCVDSHEQVLRNKACRRNRSSRPCAWRL
ncbi:MAG TPA: hypothetical protein VE957_04790 [Terriglobales bacterium]|nr:hypothetical protein [Terriglobales bacterium]